MTHSKHRHFARESILTILDIVCRMYYNLYYCHLFMCTYCICLFFSYLYFVIRFGRKVHSITSCPIAPSGSMSHSPGLSHNDHLSHIAVCFFKMYSNFAYERKRKRIKQLFVTFTTVKTSYLQVMYFLSYYLIYLFGFCSPPHDFV